MVCDDYRLFVLLLTTSSIVAAVSEETLNVYALQQPNLITRPKAAELPGYIAVDTQQQSHLQ